MARNIQTTQQTGKGWKLLQVIGVLFILAAGMTAFVRVEVAGAEQPERAWVWLLGMGLTVFFTGRIGGWWYHG